MGFCSQINGLVSVCRKTQRNKGFKMALAKLDKSNKVVVVANSSLEYTDNEGNIKQKEPKTAALNVIKEAAQVAKMDVGTVQASFKIGEEWKNYWVNVDDKTNNVSLKPCNSNDKSQIIYVNAYEKEGGKYDLSLNSKNEAGREFVNGLNVKAYVNEQEAKTTNYVESRITLTNENIKKSLMEKGEGSIAVLSNEGVNITTAKELQQVKEQARLQQPTDRSQTEARLHRQPVEQKPVSIEI